MSIKTINRNIPEYRENSGDRFRVRYKNKFLFDRLVVNVCRNKTNEIQVFTFQSNELPNKDSIYFSSHIRNNKLHITWSGLESPHMRTDNITIIATNTEPKSRSSSNLVYSKSFPPILGPKPRVLILGTMPGKESLKRQQYYANPRNLFWRLIYNLHDAHHEDSYSDRVSFLINKNISVWDVCHKGIRETSLDSDIKDEISNDLESFLKTNSTIKIIAFNGQKAEKLYNKYYSRLDGIAYFTLLSTSPANASYSFDEKFADWSKIIKL